MELSTAKVVRVIFLAEENGADSPQVRRYISSLNEDEQANLVALGIDVTEVEDRM